MKESAFCHYYHLDDPLHWHQRYGSRVIYKAQRVLFGNILQQGIDNRYTSKLAEWADSFNKYAIPECHKEYILIPIKLYDPKILYDHRYSLKISEESMPFIKHIGLASSKVVSFRMNGNNETLHFSYTRCAEYCDSQNSNFSITTACVFDYLYKLEENVLVAELAVKLGICLG